MFIHLPEEKLSSYLTKIEERIDFTNIFCVVQTNDDFSIVLPPRDYQDVVPRKLCNIPKGATS